MLALSFFSWWYGRGWKQIVTGFGQRMANVRDAFSVIQLLRTLFAPWRRIVTPAGRSIQERWRAAVDNMFSRVIGFIVRLGVLLAAALTLLGVGVLTVVEIIVWPLLPPAIVICLIAGLLQ